MFHLVFRDKTDNTGMVRGGSRAEFSERTNLFRGWKHLTRRWKFCIHFHWGAWTDSLIGARFASKLNFALSLSFFLFCCLPTRSYFLYNYEIISWLYEQFFLNVSNRWTIFYQAHEKSTICDDGCQTEFWSLIKWVEEKLTKVNNTVCLWPQEGD